MKNLCEIRVAERVENREIFLWPYRLEVSPIEWKKRRKGKKEKKQEKGEKEEKR